MNDSLINDYGSESEMSIQTFNQTIVTEELPPLRRRKSRTEWIEELQREAKVQEKLL